MGLFGSQKRCGAQGTDGRGRPLACSYTLGDHEYKEARGGGVAPGGEREHLDSEWSRYFIVSPDGDLIVTQSPQW